MAKRLDSIIVVDVESTCWEGNSPVGEESEIIEIGYALLDTGSLEQTDNGSFLVCPTRSKVSLYCTELTTLIPEAVEDGITFEEACRLLKTRFDSRSRTWASYGDYDRRQFERQCVSFGVAYPFGPTHLNVKNMFALVHCLPHEVGMDEALRILGLHLEGTHHRGIDDAKNVARILAALLAANRNKETSR